MGCIAQGWIKIYIFFTNFSEVRLCLNPKNKIKQLKICNPPPPKKERKLQLFSRENIHYYAYNMPLVVYYLLWWLGMWNIKDNLLQMKDAWKLMVSFSFRNT